MMNNINKVDKNGLRTGFWRLPNGDGGIDSEGHYTDGEKTGIWIVYKQDGKTLMHEINYDDIK